MTVIKLALIDGNDSTKHEALENYHNQKLSVGIVSAFQSEVTLRIPGFFQQVHLCFVRVALGIIRLTNYQKSFSHKT